MAAFVKFDKVFTNNRQIPIVVIVIMVGYGRIHSKTKGFDRNYSSNQVRKLAAARLVAEIDKMTIL